MLLEAWTQKPWNRRENPEIATQKYAQLIPDRGANAIQCKGGKTAF